MSFLGGPECSTAANPLSQFTKHVQDDKSLQRDRLVGRGPGGLGESMRNQPMGPQDAMMDEFMQQNAQLPQGPASQPFAMEQMRRELENTQRRSASPNWAQEFDPGIPHQQGAEPAFQRPGNAGFSQADFAKFQQASRTSAASPLQQSQPMMSGYRQMGSMYGGGYGGMGMGMGMQRNYSPGFAQQQQQPQDLKGKGRMVELDDQDWEAQFASLDQVDQEALDREANAAMEEELSGIDRSVQDPSYTETDHFGDFESIWRGIQAENESLRKMAEYDDIGENFHMGDDMEQWQNFDGLNTHSTQDPALGDYLFEEDNFFKQIPNAFEEGMRIMNEGGNLSLAALAFEAAVQKDPQHVEAWVALGQAQAQNEKETPAIRSLERAVKLDPSNLPALMSLAVSYTNEGYDSTAYRTLERWVATKYPSLITQPLTSETAELEMGFTDRHALHEKVTSLFLRAAQLSPSGEQMDPDVQVGLGVLFYGAEEYDKAIDCFEAALASTEDGVTNSRSEVHLLWNRLGATKANSGQSEEAIDAYSHALELRPNFVRARYNLGVSCINIGCYAEAAGHLLGALAMHRVVEREGKEKARELVGGEPGEGNLEEKIERMMMQNQSTNLFDTLRRIFGMMGRRELMEKVGPGMDLDAFKGEFEF
ncbi:peroxisomal targeting signal receptor [Elsinoe australis]|uniref:Peroxisomal targeting signal receptor n=1 Tax=Elsinoe australis TaxID=40998 RepID=A0A4U7BCI9_9PEZI|nr:peroxisomal targeting signal receptor [Elsinoe australis]